MFRSAIARLALGCAVTLLFAVQNRAEDPDAAKLIGQWVPAAVPERQAASFTRTFTKDGKYSFGGSLKLEGTYKVEGSKLTTKFNDVPGVPGEVQVYTIKKLTDTELSLMAGKSTETFKRLKQPEPPANKRKPNAERKK